MRRQQDDSRSEVARRYDRVAWVYDVYDAPMNWFGGSRRRRRVLRRARGRTLEVGVGTGRNLDCYPEGVELTGIDISRGMLARAEKRAEALRSPVKLHLADVEHLPFPDASFDTVTATCVFCSVDAPVRGLEEIRRVVKPTGRVLLLEHVRPRGRAWGWLADRLTPLIRRVFGPDINRRTEENVHRSGLRIVDVKRQGVWREIEARPTEGEQ